MTASKNPLELLKWNSRRTNSQADQNWENCLREAGTWEAGTYVKNQVVIYNGALWVAQQTTTETPNVLSGHWQPWTPYPGQGSMYLGTPPAATTDIGAGWQTLDGFDSVDPIAQGITLNTTNNTFQFLWRGVWDWTLYLNISHNELNQSRESNVRLYNETTATPGEGVPFYIARNQSGSMITIPVRQLITDTERDDVWRIEIGGGDTVSAVAYEALSLDFSQLSAA